MTLVWLVGNLSWAADLQSLVNNPPFGSKVSQSNPSDATQVLEFRGTFVDGNERFFSLHDPVTRSSQWVGLNESGQPYVVEAYDSAKGSIQVRYRNQLMTLSLKLAQIVVQAAPSPATASTPLPPWPSVANSSPSTEASRLAQVAEEIRRRRALRSSGPLPPQYSADNNPPRPGPIPQQNAAGNQPRPGPIPQNSNGNLQSSGPVLQRNNTGNPPGPGPIPNKP